MIAFSAFSEKGDLNRAEAGFHPPGIQMGDRFKYRAQLAICGVHEKLMRGIDFKYCLEDYCLV